MFGGSGLKAKGMLDPYRGSSKGISMRLSAVQGINPVAHGDDNFDSVDGGYVAEGADNGSTTKDDDEDFDF